MQRTFRKALITGASRGLGFEIAKALKERGTQIVLAAHNVSALEKAGLSIGATGTYALDLTNRAQRQEFIHKVIANHCELDLVINNAGTMLHSNPLNSPNALALAENETALMLSAPMHLSYAFLPQLQKTKGALVNVTTGLIYAPIASAPAYSGVKAGLHAFT